ncbi:uncharacterized protein LOC123484318 [Coregonus clupeaformis]|uniref:uncharacterized protein LOC123484318 n=1 Tax=Coregonus clupeaformis TaxID=59861 RepID=UPI001E1C8FAB|nr:uncharacterized protein LOC123484318 [Coregonus clupeaformis]
MNKTISERVKFVQGMKLCFGCLKPGHRSKECENRRICDTCEKGHPTCLHDNRSKERGMSTRTDGEMESDKSREGTTDRSQERVTKPPREVTSNRVIQNVKGTHTSSVIPVWLSTTSKPNHEVLVYALLDTQSDTTFILEETAKVLHTKNEPVQLKLSTMASRNTVVPSRRLTDLQIRGFYSDKIIYLPVTYSREFIPANRDHIPTPETAKAWSHLEHIADEIAPLQSCDIGLLIGYNCPQALVPRQVVAGEENEPFAQRTDLGWSVVGYGNPCLDFGDAFGISHQVIVKQVTSVLPNLPNEVHYVCRTQIKEVVLPTDVIKVLESDFVERASEDEHLSQEDLQFMSIMESGIRLKDDGHYEMPLPFKKGRPNLPDNKVCGIHRLRCLEKKLKGNEQYCRDYKTFMDETIASEDNPADHASRGVTAEQLTASNWFTGPDLLWQKELPTGVVMVGEIESSDPEVNKAQVHDTQAEEAKTILDRLHNFSDWARMVKAVARLKRRAKEIKGLKPKSCEASNLEERKETELTIIKMVQEATLSQEIQRLRHHKETKVKDKANQLHKLCPFLDDQGVIRVGGRLANAALHPHVRHPAVLPRDSHVSALLVKHYHERVYQRSQKCKGR